MLEMFKKLLPKDSIFRFLITFLALFAVLYTIAHGWAGITTPANYYSPFVDKYLNYIAWVRDSLMHTVNFIAHFLGYNSYIEGIRIRVLHGHGVSVDYPCIGYGIFSCWIAFVLSYPANKAKRIKWFLGGVFVIWLCNVIRILLLLILVNGKKAVNVNAFGDHHDVYNFVVYGIIVVMIYFYTKEKKEVTPIAQQQSPN